jgi:hypothetical protein
MWWFSFMFCFSMTIPHRHLGQIFFFIAISSTKFAVFLAINSPNFQPHKIDFFPHHVLGRYFNCCCCLKFELVIRKGDNHRQISSFHLVPHIWHVHKLLLWTCEKLKVMFWELQGTFLILKLLPVWACHKEEGKIHQSLEHEQRAYDCSTMAASTW